MPKRRRTISQPNNRPPEPLPPIRVDEDGDLELRVGAEADGREQEILVCSAALRRATPAWKTMLFGGFKESRPATGRWVVPLPADKAAPILVFMNIIHSRFDQLPKKPDLSLLYDISITADKYELFDLIEPWIPQWSIAVEDEKQSKDGDTIVRLTFVSWALRQDAIYKTMRAELILACSVNEQGHLSMPDGTCLNDYPRIGPHDLLETIEKQRITRLKMILTAFHALIKKLLQGKAQHSCNSSKDCVYLTLGSIWCAMTNSRGSFLPEEAGDLTESVDTFADSITKILSSVRSSSSEGPYGLQKCNHTSQVVRAVQDAISPTQLSGPSIHTRKPYTSK